MSDVRRGTFGALLGALAISEVTDGAPKKLTQTLLATLRRCEELRQFIDAHLDPLEVELAAREPFAVERDRDFDKCEAGDGETPCSDHLCPSNHADPPHWHIVPIGNIHIPQPEHARSLCRGIGVVLELPCKSATQY